MGERMNEKVSWRFIVGYIIGALTGIAIGVPDSGLQLLITCTVCAVIFTALLFYTSEVYDDQYLDEIEDACYDEDKYFTEEEE